MKDLTKVYLLAAELCQKEIEDAMLYSCWKVNQVVSGHGHWGSTYEKELYEGVFTETPKDFCQQIEDVKKEGIDPNELRVLLLCMMAACWKDFV